MCYILLLMYFVFMFHSLCYIFQVRSFWLLFFFNFCSSLQSSWKITALFLCALLNHFLLSLKELFYIPLSECLCTPVRICSILVTGIDSWCEATVPWGFLVLDGSQHDIQWSAFYLNISLWLGLFPLSRNSKHAVYFLWDWGPVITSVQMPSLLLLFSWNGVSSR